MAGEYVLVTATAGSHHAVTGAHLTAIRVRRHDQDPVRSLMSCEED
jgi:hypothetical protein